MVEVGEQTGALDEMLQRLAIMYNDEVEQTADNLATILEPILIVLMGAVVGGIVICLYLPMFDYIKLVH
jgi:type IV pilus assembly protein PilC